MTLLNDIPWQACWRDAVRQEDDLVRFVREVGFCTINQLPRWPAFPSQEFAMGIPDVLGVTWFWKDDLHTQRRLYYTRLFAGRPGFVSLELLPTFIATNGEVADELIHFGRLPVTTREICAASRSMARFLRANLKHCSPPKRAVPAPRRSLTWNSASSSARPGSPGARWAPMATCGTWRSAGCRKPSPPQIA